MKKESLIPIVITVVALFFVVQTAQAVTLTDPNASIDVLGGEYRVYQNVWGASTPQTLEVDPNSTYFKVVSTGHNQSGGAPASYPFILKGSHFGGTPTSPNNPLPIQVPNVTSAPTTWEISGTGAAGIWNAAYDCWFVEGTTNRLEMMIWINYKGGCQPAGSKRTTTSIGGHTWDVWYNGSSVLSYKIVNVTNSVSLDIKDFMNDAVSRGWLNTAWDFGAFEAGFEIWTDGSGLTSNSFTADANPSGPPNDPPTVAITSPADGATFAADADITITADASDSDGSVTKVEFFEGANKLGEDTSAPYQYTWYSVPEAYYTLTARATDNGGATATSAAVNITVGSPPEFPVDLQGSTPEEKTISLTVIKPAGVTDATLEMLVYDPDYPDEGALYINGDVNSITLFGSQGTSGNDGATVTVTYDMPASWWNDGSNSLRFTHTSTGGYRVESASVTFSGEPPPEGFPVDLQGSTPEEKTVTLDVTKPAGVTDATLEMLVYDPDYADEGYLEINGSANSITLFGSETGGDGATITVTYNTPASWWNDGANSLRFVHTSTVGYVIESASVTFFGGGNEAPTVSITSPADGATFTEGANITINANASDTDGSVTLVEFFQGSTKLGEDATSPYSYTWNNVSAASYSLTAVATDNESATTTSSAVNITVNISPPPGGFPVDLQGTTPEEATVSLDVTKPADATDATLEMLVYDPDQTNEGTLYINGDVNTITMFGSQGTSANDGLTVTVTYNTPASWWVDGANSLRFTHTSTAGYRVESASVTFSSAPPPEGNIALGKTATSSSNESSSYPPANAVDGNGTTRWSSEFSDPQWISIDLAQTYSISRVLLNWETAYGSAYQIQTSNDGSSWTNIYSTTTGNGGVDDLTGLSGSGRYIRMYGTARGTSYGYSLYEFEVYGTSGDNISPTVSITSPANGATFTEPANITINADASDSDGSVTLVEFFQGSTKLGEDASSPYSYTWSNVAAGSYSLTAKATDNEGATTTSSAVNITVNRPGNQPPTVSITSPANGATFTEPADITINADASDSDGSVTLVEFFQGSTKLGEDATSPYSYTWSNVAAGSYSLTAKATDNGGAATTSSAVNITVSSPAGATYYRINNRWIHDYLYDDGDQVLYGSLDVSDQRSHWELEDYDGHTKLRNRSTGDYAHIEHLYSYVECTAIAVGATSAQWTLETYEGHTRFKNRQYSDRYINVQSQLGYAECSVLDPWTWSSHWTLEEVALPKPLAQDESQIRPTEFSLGQNYPNPFNPETSISYQLPEASKVQLEIYDITGCKVRVLVNSEQSAGSHIVWWNGLNESGQRVANGMYIYRFKATSANQVFTQIKKMLLLK